MATEFAEKTRELESEALSWPVRARAVEIIDQASYNAGAHLLLNIAELERQIVEHHAPIKKAAFEAHKVAVVAEKRLLDPLVEAKGVLKRAIGAWEQEQEQIRQEQERQARVEAARREEELRLQAAIQAEQEGASPEIVEEIVNTPIQDIPAPVVAATFNRVAGISTRENWRAEVIDLKALCKAIAEGMASANFVVPNMPALNQVARAMKSTMNVPGVRAVKETGVAARVR